MGVWRFSNRKFSKTMVIFIAFMLVCIVLDLDMSYDLNGDGVTSGSKTELGFFFLPAYIAIGLMVHLHERLMNR